MKNLLLSLNCLFTAVFTNAQSPKLEWAKQIGGTLGAIAHGYSIAVDASGNVYTTGYFHNTIDFDPGVGIFNLTSFDSYDDIFISKLDASGNFVWAKQISGTEDDYGFSMALDASGNVYTTGMFDGTADFDPGSGAFNLSSTAGSGDIFISKLDPSGNFVWGRKMGGTSIDGARSITLDASGNVYTTGFFEGTADFDPGAATFNLTAVEDGDIFISKLNASGNFVWAKKMGGASGDYGSSIALDASGNVYTTGEFGETVDFDPGTGVFNLTASGGYSGVFISKLNPSGDFIWAKNMLGNGDADVSSIKVDATGNVYTTGFFEGTADFDPGSGTFNLTSAGSSDIFISKLSASGSFIWAKKIGGRSFDGAMSIALDASGNVYTSGFYKDTADFDPGTGIFNLFSPGISEIYISKLDASGSFVWAEQMHVTAGAGAAYAMTIDNNGQVYTTGWFRGNADFDTGSDSFKLTAVFIDMFVHKMSESTTGIKEDILIGNIIIYPNPNNGVFNLVLSEPTDITRIEIYNSLGVLVYQQSCNEAITEVDLSNQVNGLYIVKVMNDKQIIATQKIMKQ